MLERLPLLAFLLLAASPAGAQEGLADTASGLGNPQGEIPLPNGLTLEYEQQGVAAGHPVIFLHGYIDSWYSFARVKPLLPAKEVRAYFLSQRGHGDSDQPECCYATEDFSADLLAFLDAKQIQKATLVGHSMGSFIARKFALEHPDRVAGLVLVGSAPVAGNAVLAELNTTVQSLTEIDPGFLEVFQSGTLCVPLPADFRGGLIGESLKAPLHVWKVALDGLVREDHSARLGEIAVPVLVAGGMKDPLFSSAEQLALAKALPHAELELYPGLCHAPHWEAPQPFTEDLLQFLRKRVWQE